MNVALASLDPRTAWEPYQPTTENPWDRRRVVQMHRRAGLGATAALVARDQSAGHATAIDRVLVGEDSLADGRPKEAIDRTLEAMLSSFRQHPSTDRLVSWWLFRAMLSPCPLDERLALAWHNHYATNQDKVASALWLADQHLRQRELARGPIAALHLAMLRDPAMLVWLDGVNSVKGRPNENLAREFLELFALGEGEYTETDVREAARALTGWRRSRDLSGRPLRYVGPEHDDGDKTILGQTGRWRDEDLVRIACEQPAAGRHIARLLWRTFISNTAPQSKELLDGLAAAMGAEINVARGLETLVRSRLFHSSVGAGSRVLNPLEFVLMTLRACESYPPSIDVASIRSQMGRMGLRLFHPPSVAGWPDGPAWLGASAAIARDEFAAWLTTDASGIGARRLLDVAERHAAGTIEAQVDLFGLLLLGVPLTDARRDEVLQAGKGMSDNAELCAAVVRRMLTMPEAQVA